MGVMPKQCGSEKPISIRGRQLGAEKVIRLHRNVCKIKSNSRKRVFQPKINQ